METSESLKRRIGVTEQLLSVVKTMKALAAANIKHHERAVAALSRYARTIDMGLHVALTRGPGRGLIARSAPRGPVGIIVLGSDQGLCGPLNEQMAAHLAGIRTQAAMEPEDVAMLAIGRRIGTRLLDDGHPVHNILDAPTTPAGIARLVQDILIRIESWRTRRGIERITLCYNEFLAGARFRPRTLHMLPLDRDWLHRLRLTPWPSHALPMFTMDRDRLFSRLVRQYLFVSLYRALAESLASENASRLMSMQRAERTIEERHDELVGAFHQQRQVAITEELLDIVSGFEALERGLI